MARFLYSVAKAPMGWAVFCDRVRIGGVHATKDEAFECAITAAALSVHDGNGAHIDVSEGIKRSEDEATQT